MRINRGNGYVKLWASPAETYAWANMPGKRWPCSTLSGRSLFAEIAPNGDLVDMALDGGRGEQDCPGDELSAFLEDALQPEA